MKFIAPRKPWTYSPNLIVILIIYVIGQNVNLSSAG